MVREWRCDARTHAPVFCVPAAWCHGGSGVPPTVHERALDVAQVCDLQGAEHLNGKWGKVESYCEDAQRYVVKLEDGKPIRVRPANVAMLLECCQCALLMTASLPASLPHTPLSDAALPTVVEKRWWVGDSERTS